MVVPLVRTVNSLGRLERVSQFLYLIMSKASDAHEHLVANYLNSIPSVKAVRPVCDTSYSDVLINHNYAEAWLEVKMGHRDNLVNPRVYYHENTWKTRYTTPVAGYIVSELNKSETALDFVYSISNHCGLAYESIYIPTNRGEMGKPNTPTKELMKSFCKTHGSYILDYQNYDISQLVTSHYTMGKTEPAYYLQAGDDFYLLSNTNPLGLSKNIPEFTGTGKLRVRVSNRSRFYEIQGEVKMQDMPSSDFSVLPNSKKLNPFL